MSDTYCDVDFSYASDDADPVAFTNRTTPVARKAHTCIECREVIPKGERYTRVAYKFEGRLWADRICASCAEAKAEFEFNILGGLFWESMEDEWDAGANVQGCMNRLTTVKSKALMHRQWLKWKGLESATAADAVDPQVADPGKLATRDKGIS